MIDDLQVLESAGGKVLRIFGSGFGEVPENLAAWVEQADGIPVLLRIIRVASSAIDVVPEPFTERAASGRVIIALGTGSRWEAREPSATGQSSRRVNRVVWAPSRTPRDPVETGDPRELPADDRPDSPLDPRAESGRGTLELRYSDVQVFGPVIAWRRAGLPAARSDGSVTPDVGMASGSRAWHVATVKDGRLCLPVDESWARATRVRLVAGLDCDSPDRASTISLEGIALPGSSTAQDAALRVANVLEAAWARIGRVDLACRFENGPSGRTELILRSAEGPIVYGTLAVEIQEAAVALREARMSQLAGALGRRLSFGFDARAGRRYRVEVRDDVESTGWRTLHSVVGEGRPLTIEDPVTAAPMRIYRVIDAAE